MAVINFFSDKKNMCSISAWICEEKQGKDIIQVSNQLHDTHFIYKGKLGIQALTD